AGVGVSSVGIGWCASPVVKAKEQSVPPFTLSSAKFDQSTYVGRLYSIFDKIDPQTLLTSDAEVKRCQGLLEEFTRIQQLPAGATDAEMWEARKTVEAIIHPVSKEPMFWLGRMSAWGFVNVPISVIMLNAQSLPVVLFAQWLNQSYNVLSNYTNRSSLTVDWAGLLKPYAVAVAVSCGIALGARRAIKSMPALARLGIFVPYLAVISAGSCNVAFTRMDEWAGRGVCIYSPEGKELGMSVKAGQQAVFDTVCTRCICLPIPVLFVPPLVMSVLPVTGAVAVVAELLVIVASIAFALPCALAILPQEM
ncbi:unnamed protein product, partial [Polarella glacialis]